MGHMGHMGGAEASVAAAPQLAAALAISRDGMVGSEAVEGVAGPQPALDAPERLGQLDAAWRAAALDAALLSGVAVDISEEGAVRVWQRTAATVSAGAMTASFAPLVEMIRPSNDDLAAQLPLVTSYADLRAERTPEILAQIDDLLSFFGAVDDLRPARSFWIIELLAAALRLAIVVEHRVKHALGCPRPALFSDRVQPIIPTPSHGALPSGHATEAFVIATVLARLAGGDPAAEVAAWSQRYRLAARIAINRTVAGVHFPADSAAGAVLGLTLGEHVAARATGGAMSAMRFDGSRYGALDFHLGSFAPLLSGALGGESAGSIGALGPVSPSPDRMLAWLWDRAAEEWSARWR
jgi:membrane-associated phospholipid phosphatase